MIWPSVAQTTEAVAAHYDELDSYYREIWGEHLHHGYFTTRRESPETAAQALIALLAARLDLLPGQQVCDIGCGYGATAQYLAERHHLHVTGLTVSGAQARQAQTRIAASGSVSIQQMDWLANDFAANRFDRAYAIESSEHMPDKQRFFSEAFRTLKPGGGLALCTWLACDDPRPWEIRHLLEPICREGRLPSLGNAAEYGALAHDAGFDRLRVEDLSDRVRHTWWICVWRLMARLATQPRYRRFLFDPAAANRGFALTLFRLLIAYRTRSLRYCLMTFRKPLAAPQVPE